MLLLLGKNPFLMGCTLSQNGFSTKMDALIDTGADGYLFMQRELALRLSERFSIPVIRTKETGRVSGYNGGVQRINEVLNASFTLGGKRYTNQSFVMLRMTRDIIIGKIFLAKHNLLPDCEKHVLIEKVPQEIEEIEPEYVAMKPTVLPKKTLFPNKILQRHQSDSLRRDALWELEEEREALKQTTTEVDEISLPVTSTASWRSDYRDSIRQMKVELNYLSECNANETQIARLSEINRLNNVRNRQKHNSARSTLQSLGIDICELKPTAFKINLRRKDNLMFATSIYEIDARIEELRNPDDDNDEEMELEDIKRHLPRHLHDLADICSKINSEKLPPHRTYDHKIELEPGSEGLKASPLYKMNEEELVALKDYLTENLKKGFIESSSAPFASPVLFVKKPNGSLRLCIDFRKLNHITKKDRYPIPLLDEVLSRMSQAKIFTKLDIRSAFNRIRMDESSEELTSFRTRYGQYKCKVLPFGLCNGPATYQRYMNDVLFEYLDTFCTAYLDDIIIFSNSTAEHDIHVRQVLEKLRIAGLQVDLKKCEFSVKETKFLGFILTTEGIKVDQEKIAVIKDWEYAHSARGVQSYLGFCNFYRRFIKDYGRIAKPLNRLTGKGVLFNFDADCKNAWEELRSALCNAPLLVHFKTDYETMLETDSSDGVVSGVLSQKQKDDLWHPIAFFTKTMNSAENNYAIHDKELLAIIRAFETWRAELEGNSKPTLVYSDHEALEYFMTTKKLSGRQARWAEMLARYHFTIKYRPGRDNQVADILSRRDQEVSASAETRAASRMQIMIPADKIDQKVQDARAKTTYEEAAATTLAPMTTHITPQFNLVDRILQANRGSPAIQGLRDQSSIDKDTSLEDGLLYYKGRLFVPDDMFEDVPIRTALIKEVHDQISAAHPGEKKTTDLLQQRYFWPKMQQSVQQYVRNCHECKRSKEPRDKQPGLLHPLPVPHRVWQHIVMDFKECPVDEFGFDAICVFVDRLGKRPISIPCHKTASARDLAYIFLEHVYRHKGAPDSIVSDRGAQFVSAFWDELCNILNIKMSLSTAHSHETAGQVEIVNQYIDQRLRPYMDFYQTNWSKMMPMMDFAQAALKHEATGQSSFMTEMAYEPRWSFDFKPIASSLTATEKLNRKEAQAMGKAIQDAQELARLNVEEAQQVYAKQANKHRREPDFDVGDMVWVSTKNWSIHRPSRKLSAKNAGPFKIIGKDGYSFHLELPSTLKMYPIFHASKLRRAATDPLPGQYNEPAPPIVINGEEEWEVEKILAVRLVYRTLKYRVKWKNHDTDLNEYPAAALVNSAKLLKEFHAKHPDLPGPPRHLQYWLECAENDITPEFRPGQSALPSTSKLANAKPVQMATLNWSNSTR